MKSAIIAAIATCTIPQIAFAQDKVDGPEPVENAANDKNILTLSPSGDWKQREYADKCRVSRRFGEGENATTLWVDQGGKEPYYNVTLIGRPLRHSYGNAVRVQFGNEKESIRSYVRAKSSKGRPVVTMFGVAIAPPKIERKTDAELEELSTQRMAAIDTFKISESIREPLTLQLGDMKEPLSFLRACGELLAISLNLEHSYGTGEARPPELLNGGNMARLIRYPNYLARSDMEAEVEFRLTINAAGKPTNCIIQRSNRPQLFDDAACLGLMKHGKFKAATDKQGQAKAAYFHSQVTFAIR